MIKILLTTCVLITFQSFASDCTRLESVDWLEGSWYSKTDKVEVKENWEKVSLTSLEGYGTTTSIKTGETISSESLRLVQMSGEVFYLAKIKSNEFPVPFKLVNCSNNLAEFENLNHDFPKKLLYRLKDEQHISAFVSDGKDKGFTIEYSREPENTQ